MEQIAVSKFKATCLAVIEKVRKTGQPILITRFGRPVAELGPPGGNRLPRRFGARSGTGQILGDIVSPVIDVDDLEVLQEPNDHNESGRYK